MREKQKVPVFAAWQCKRANRSGFDLDAVLSILICVLLAMFVQVWQMSQHLVAVRQTQESRMLQLERERSCLTLHARDAVQRAERALGQEAELVATIDAYRLQFNTYIQTLIPSGSPLDPVHRVSSGYGFRTHPVLREKKLHRGLDFAVPEGSPVRATADGIVSLASSGASLGKFVTLRHAYGFSTLYAHLSQSMVKAGQVLRKGDVLGLSGNTGLSTGAHLHYELSYLGTPLNPRPFLDWAAYEARWITEWVPSVPWGTLLENVPWK